MEQDLSGFRPSRLWKRLPVERRIDRGRALLGGRPVDRSAAGSGCGDRLAHEVQDEERPWAGPGEACEVPGYAAEPLGRHRGARPRELSPRATAADDGGVPGQRRNRARGRSDHAGGRRQARDRQAQGSRRGSGRASSRRRTSPSISPHSCRRTPARGATSPRCRKRLTPDGGRVLRRPPAGRFRSRRSCNPASAGSCARLQTGFGQQAAPAIA